MDQSIRLADVTRMLMLAQKSETREAHALDYCTWLALHAHTRGSSPEATELYQARYARTRSAELLTKSVQLYSKALVAVGTTTGADYAAPLVTPKEWSEGFTAQARSASVLGRLPGLREVPFNTKIASETAAAAYTWVAENSVKPVSAMAFSNGFTLTATKTAAIIVLSKEFLTVTNRATAKALQDELVAGLVGFVDKSFLDPTSTAIAGQRPASITAGTTPVAGTGNLQTDVKSLLTAFYAARPGAADPVLIAGGGNAAAIRGMQPGFGLTVIASEAAGTNVIVVDPSGVFVAANNVEVEYSDKAMLQMNSTPDNPATAATVLVSLWQINCVGYRVEQVINFAAAAGAVKYLTTP